MDWGKAKTILIISFLCLNVLLGYQLWTSKLGIDKTNQRESETSESISQLMKSKGITIDATIPVSVPKLREITVTFDPTTDAVTRTTLNSLIDISIVDSKTGLRDLAKHIPQAEQYQLDPMAQKGDLIVLNQLYGDLPMFEVNLKLYHKDNQVQSYWQSHVVVHQGQNAAEKKVITALTALGKLAEKLEAGTLIIDVQLGYHGQIYNSETQVLAPAWRVATSKGDLYFVHAINGAFF